MTTTAEALELATNEELVAELMRRTTFRGIVLWMRENYRGVPDKQWRWRSTTTREDAAALMHEIAGKIDGGQDEPMESV